MQINMYNCAENKCVIVDFITGSLVHPGTTKQQDNK